MKAYWLDNGVHLHPSDLESQGVLYRSLSPTAADYQPTLDRLKEDEGYTTQDIVELSPSTPNLEDICAKFDPEHLHTGDEVRFVLEGAGIFDIRSTDDRMFRVEVTPGDLIVVPKDRHHRFELTEARHIRCVRLFQDAAGWVPHYRD